MVHWYVERRLGKVGKKNEKHDLTSCLKFSGIEYILRRQGREAIGSVWSFNQSESLVNKLFLRKNLYRHRMEDGNSLTKHLNAFDTLISKLV